MNNTSLEKQQLNTFKKNLRDIVIGYYLYVCMDVCIYLHKYIYIHIYKYGKKITSAPRYKLQ